MKRTKLIVSSLAVLLALILVLGGGAYAYLTGQTDEVVNEFTPNSNGVTLSETTGDVYDIIPGTSQEKDPVVTATYTLDSYAFVVVTDATGGLVDYAISSDWSLLSEETEDSVTTYVYYILVDAENADSEEDGTYTKAIRVLEGNVVSYSEMLTNEDMANADSVSLTFQAYICQAQIGESETTPENAYLIATGNAVTVIDGVAYSELQEAISAAADGSTITLWADTEVSAALTVSDGQDVTIDLNGYTITETSSSNRVVTVEGSTLTLENGTITGGSYGVYAQNGSTVTLENVTITGTNSTIAAVSVASGSTLIMESGTISNNAGVGVSLAAKSSTYGESTFIMNGGTISGNAKGGVQMNGSTSAGGSVFVMNDGEISGNTGQSYGGGVYVKSAAQFTMNGGTITGNTAKSRGAGVYVAEGLYSPATARTYFTMTGGTINGNSLTDGSTTGADLYLVNATSGKIVYSIDYDNVTLGDVYPESIASN